MGEGSLRSALSGNRSRQRGGSNSNSVSTLTGVKQRTSLFVCAGTRDRLRAGLEVACRVALRRMGDER